MSLEGKLDFELAWKRVKNDLKENCFCNNPYINNIIDYNSIDYFKNLDDNITNYKPTIPPIIDVPKKDWHIRPACMLTIDDQVVYSAILLYNIKKIKNALKWSVNKKRFSYILKNNQNTEFWLDYGWWNFWTKFNDKSIKLAKKYDYVLITDIAGYFENISIGRLMSDLKSLDFENETKNLLSKCLNAWAQNEGKSIPQGYTTSSILAEVYLDSIDKELDRNGIKHTRYVDDIRIFCESHEDCVKALHLLTRLLRSKELNIQTAKSKILTNEEAIEEMTGITPIINDIDHRIKDKLKRIPPYRITNKIIRKEKGLNLEKIFQEKILDQNPDDFNKTLFHYLLNRINSPLALEYCSKLMFQRPEETLYILDYFSRLYSQNIEFIGKTENLTNKILLESKKEFIYEYQQYLLIKWLYENKIKSNTIISTVRKFMKKSKNPKETFEYCIAYLGENGETNDLDFLLDIYGSISDIYTKATTICSLKKMEKSRRNALYGRESGNGDLLEFAVKYAKSI